MPHASRAFGLASAVGACSAAAPGRRPESGLLLLRSLRQLYLQAQEVSFHWIIAGQLAQATRDHALPTLVDELHRETLTQIKWLKTQVKQASPHVMTRACRRRLAVTSDDSTLLGLLCLKASGLGFCSDADIADRSCTKD